MHFNILIRLSKNRNVQIENVAVLSDLCPANYYESQIMSALKRWKGKRIQSYKQLTGGNYTALFAMRNKFDQNQSSFFSTIKVKSFVVGASVECDLYFKPLLDDDSDIDLSGFLSGAVTELKQLSAQNATDSMDGKWIFVEISQGSKFLLQKLWQLERAVQILPLIDANFNPSNLVVLLNGDKEEAIYAMENIRIPPEAKILQYPLFVGWTPTRNIFKILGTLQEDMAIMKDEMGDMKTDITDMKTDITGVKTDITDIKSLLQQLLENQKK